MTKIQISGASKKPKDLESGVPLVTDCQLDVDPTSTRIKTKEPRNNDDEESIHLPSCSTEQLKVARSKQFCICCFAFLIGVAFVALGALLVLSVDEAYIHLHLSPRGERYLKPRGTTFRLIEKNLLRDAADAECRQWGGALASLNTPTKRELAGDMIPEGTWVWVGAKCERCSTYDDDWFWETGDRLSRSDNLWKRFHGKRTPWANGFTAAQFGCKSGICEITSVNPEDRHLLALCEK